MSSKTRRASAGKIKSERRLILLGLGGVLIVGLALALFYWWRSSQLAVPQVTLQNISYPKFYCLKFVESQQGCSSDLEVADTPAARTLGLSGRPSLAGSKGMIFIFDSPAEECMWMKDMRFSLDMIWLDSENRVTKLERNVTPESYPKTYCSTGRYVIELPAGKVENLKIKSGQKLYF